jgi:hypothetical protein
MKTHWGGASPSFAALEQALQRDVAEARARDGALPAASLHRARCLLEFLFALEQGAAHAARGGHARAPPRRAAAAFFAANDPVCRQWFGRMRSLALRSAVAAGMDRLAVHHGLRRLAELQAHAQAPRPPSADGAAPEAAAPPADAPLRAEEAASAGVAESLGPRRVLLLQRPPAESGASPAAGAATDTQGSAAASALRERIPAGLRRSAVQKGAAEASELLAGALRRLRDADALAGVQAFCQQQQALAAVPAGCGPAHNSAATDAWGWLEAARLLAAGSCERALGALQALQQGGASALVAAQLEAEAYAEVGDWGGLQQWLKVGTTLFAAMNERPTHAHAFLE